MNFALTNEEQNHVRGALQFLRRKAGGWRSLGVVLRMKEETLAHAASNKAVTPDLAFRVARFAGVGVDDVLSGRFPEPGTCPYCGHVAPVSEAPHEGA